MERAGQIPDRENGWEGRTSSEARASEEEEEKKRNPVRAPHHLPREFNLRRNRRSRERQTEGVFFCQVSLKDFRMEKSIGTKEYDWSHLLQAAANRAKRVQDDSEKKRRAEKEEEERAEKERRSQEEQRKKSEEEEKRRQADEYAHRIVYLETQLGIRTTNLRVDYVLENEGKEKHKLISLKGDGMWIEKLLELFTDSVPSKIEVSNGKRITLKGRLDGQDVLYVLRDSEGSWTPLGESYKDFIQGDLADDIKIDHWKKITRYSENMRRFKEALLTPKAKNQTALNMIKGLEYRTLGSPGSRIITLTCSQFDQARRKILLKSPKNKAALVRVKRDNDMCSNLEGALEKCLPIIDNNDIVFPIEKNCNKNKKTDNGMFAVLTSRKSPSLLKALQNISYVKNESTQTKVILKKLLETHRENYKHAFSFGSSDSIPVKIDIFDEKDIRSQIQLQCHQEVEYTKQCDNDENISKTEACARSRKHRRICFDINNAILAKTPLEKRENAYVIKIGKDHEGLKKQLGDKFIHKQKEVVLYEGTGETDIISIMEPEYKVFYDEQRRALLKKEATSSGQTGATPNLSNKVVWDQTKGRVERAEPYDQRHPYTVYQDIIDYLEFIGENIKLKIVQSPYHSENLFAYDILFGSFGEGPDLYVFGKTTDSTMKSVVRGGMTVSAFGVYCMLAAESVVVHKDYFDRIKFSLTHLWYIEPIIQNVDGELITFKVGPRGGDIMSEFVMTQQLPNVAKCFWNFSKRPISYFNKPRNVLAEFITELVVDDQNGFTEKSYHNPSVQAWEIIFQNLEIKTIRDSYNTYLCVVGDHDKKHHWVLVRTDNKPIGRINYKWIQDSPFYFFLQDFLKEANPEGYQLIQKEYDSMHARNSGSFQ